MIDPPNSKKPLKVLFNPFLSKHFDSKTGSQIKNSTGFTLIELIVVAVIIGVLATIAFFGYLNYVEKAKIVTVKNELNMLEKEIHIYGLDNTTRYPPDLAAVGYVGFLDPWGRLYVYQPDLTIAPRTREGNPVNTDFDLYSLGKNGLSVQDIDAPQSQDDLIRAGNGAYKGFPGGY